MKVRVKAMGLCQVKGHATDTRLKTQASSIKTKDPKPSSDILCLVVQGKEAVEKVDTGAEKARTAEEVAKADAAAKSAAEAAAAAEKLPTTPTVLARGKHTTSALASPVSAAKHRIKFTR